MVGRFVAKLLGDLLVGILVELTLTACSTFFARRRKGRQVRFA